MILSPGLTTCIDMVCNKVTHSLNLLHCLSWIRRHLGMASRKSIGTSNSNSNTLIHIISVEFTLHS